MAPRTSAAFDGAPGSRRSPGGPKDAPIVERRRVQAQLELVPVDGVVALQPTFQAALWGARERQRHASFCEDVMAVHRDLLTFAKEVLPPSPPAVLIDLLPPEPALFERTPGRDEVRLRLRAVGDSNAVRRWAHALWTNLRDCGAKVEPSQWPWQGRGGVDAPSASGGA
jgi:hypothetical protein